MPLPSSAPFLRAKSTSPTSTLDSPCDEIPEIMIPLSSFKEQPRYQMTIIPSPPILPTITSLSIRTSTITTTTTKKKVKYMILWGPVWRCIFVLGMTLFLTNARKIYHRMTTDLNQRNTAMVEDLATVVSPSRKHLKDGKDPLSPTTSHPPQHDQQVQVADYRHLDSDSETESAINYESYDNYSSPGEERYDFKEILEGDKNIKKGQHTPWALFYNVFVPVDGNETEISQVSSMKIVQEQLHQISSSYAAKHHENFTLPIFYNSIGGTVERGFLKSSCIKDANLECHNMKNYPVGAYEEVTLQRVWEYCQVFPDHQVMYMHSKGTYHSRQGKNDWWRRHMTYAISHELCLNPPINETTNQEHQTNDPSQTPRRCDMCGLVFNPMPWIHYSGNFFTAQCSYIKKLLPLPVYRTKLEQLAVISRAHKNASRFKFRIIPDNDAYMGLDRYASENWAASHPELQACDISRARNVNLWKKRRVHPENPEEVGPGDLHPNVSFLMNFSFAPRLAKEVHGISLFSSNPQKNEKNDRMREYWLLGGNLLKWMYLYNHTLPPRDSWVWDYYPDGEDWSQIAYQYQQQGPAAVIMAALEGYAERERNPALENDFNTGDDESTKKKQKKNIRGKKKSSGKDELKHGDGTLYISKQNKNGGALPYEKAKQIWMKMIEARKEAIAEKEIMSIAVKKNKRLKNLSE